MSCSVFCSICEVLYQCFTEGVKAVNSGCVGSDHGLEEGMGCPPDREKGTSEQFVTFWIYELILQLINAPAGTIQNPAGDFIKVPGSLIKGEEIKYLREVGRKERQPSYGKINASGGEI